MRRCITQGLGLLLLASCSVGTGDYKSPSDLEESSFISRTRLLGATGNPPEVEPGDSATFSRLIADPYAELDAVVWLACDTTDDLGCSIDFEDLTTGDLTEEELRERGVIGLEPGFPPQVTIPTDYLDDLEPADRLEGRPLLIQLVAIPNIASLSPDNVDFGKLEVGYFDLIVSEATTPNNNPWFTDEWYIDGLPIGGQAVIEVDSQQEYALGVRMPPEAIETYEYVNSNGEIEIRRESPWVAWYTTAGEQTEDITLYPYLDADWRAPYCPAFFDAVNQIPACDGIEGTWYAVVRDRRGGMAFKQQAFRVRPE